VCNALFFAGVTIDSDSARFSRALRSAILWPVGVIFIAAVLLFLIILFLFYVVRWSDHSFEVLAETALCENQVGHLQNQVRGYVITGDPTFIGPFDQERSEVVQSFDRLKWLVQDNLPQVARVEDLIRQRELWLNQLQQTIAERGQGTDSNIATTVTSKKLMDDLSSGFDAFNRVEEDLRQQRLKNVQRMQHVLLYAGSGLLVLLSLTVGFSVKRHFTNLAGDYRSALLTIGQRQTELEAQKEWFRVTLTSIGDGVIVADDAGRVVFMNHEAETLTEWKSGEAHLQPLPSVFKIIYETTRKPAQDPVAAVLREKKMVGLANHMVLISRNGVEWPIEDSAAPMYNAEGKILGVVLVFHNATEMRRAQNALKAYSEDLERKVAERTASLQETVTELQTFSYTISHDLRSPLRAMQGFAQAILEDYGNKLDDHGREYLDRIKNAAERLDRLIQDLLAYARITRQESSLVPLDLDKFVREIIEHYPHLRPPAVQIEIVGQLPRVLGREAAMTQVISNLLGNAAKFVSPSKAPHIKVWSQDRDSKIRLWIEDNGIGIAQKDFERIFQMFTQINEPALYGGTGIGLAIVKKAVQSMQGSVGVESEEGKGSEFWVELIKAS